MEQTTRRHFLAAAAAPLAGLSGCQSAAPGTTTDATTATAGATTATTTRGTAAGSTLPESVALETLAGGLAVPLDVAFAPGADRRYVATQPGRVFVHEADGLREEPFLDLRETVDFGGEKGLLGLALHPGFADNRRAFVRYSAPPREGTPDGYSHTFVLAEFRAGADGRRLDPVSERTILELPEPQSNHNAGDIAFGPDGYLYVAVGDGGAADDRGAGHAEDWYGGVPGGNGQDVTENLLGSILRIDVDRRGDGTPYAIPGDNPLVGTEGLDEHYAWGLRNPWRMAFDRGRLIAGDVGQSDYEEVNVVRRGGNYGWNVREGTDCFAGDDCPARTPDGVRGGEPLVDPVVAYPHRGAPVSGVSVIGGEVYRGDALPGLRGRYVFADLAAGGQLFVATPGDGRWPVRTVGVAGGIDRVLAFGRDARGEVYVLGGGRRTGGLHRVVPAE